MHGQFMNVFAGLHLLDGLPFELEGASTPMKGASFRRVSKMGFSP
jgi:hypothetical protein